MTGADKKEREALIRLADVACRRPAGYVRPGDRRRICREQGNPSKNAEAMRALFEKSVLKSNKDRLQAAQAGLEADQAAPTSTKIVSMTNVRDRLKRTLAMCPPGDEANPGGPQRKRVVRRRHTRNASGPRRTWDHRTRRRKRQSIVTRLTPAERLLQELGITEPTEINLEAIAFHLGARVRYRKLEGCEARIIGRNDAAIITIGKDCSDRRKRFSLAHEIGHWTHHKGQTLVCRIEETAPRRERCLPSASQTTTRPIFLCRATCSVRPLASYPKLNFKTVNRPCRYFSNEPVSDRYPSCRRRPLASCCSFVMV